MAFQTTSKVGCVALALNGAENSVTPVRDLIMRTSSLWRTQSATLGTAESASCHRLSVDLVANFGRIV